MTGRPPKYGRTSLHRSPLSVRLSLEARAILEVVADAEGKGPSELAREILEAELRAYVIRNLCRNLIILDEATTAERKRTHRGRVADVAADVRGAIADADRAIATFAEAWGRAEERARAASRRPPGPPRARSR